MIAFIVTALWLFTPLDEIRVDGTLGTIDDAEVQRALQSAGPELQACYQNGAVGFRYLGGAVRIQVRVDRNGRTRAAAIDDSTLGSWAVERCLLDTARKLAWPKPSGGDALVHIPLEFRGSAEPATMDDLQVNAAAPRLRGIYRCAGGPKSIQVTLYVGAGGLVTSAGFGGPVAPAWGDCALSKIKAAALDDPLGRVIKGTVRP